MATIKQTERESKSFMAEVLSSSGGCVRLLLSAVQRALVCCKQHWRFEEYRWGMVLDDVRLRSVLHVVVVVPAAGLSVLMIHEWVVTLPMVLFVVLLLLLLVSLSSVLPHYYRHHSEQNSSPALLFLSFPCFHSHFLCGLFRLPHAS